MAMSINHDLDAFNSRNQFFRRQVARRFIDAEMCQQNNAVHAIIIEVVNSILNKCGKRVDVVLFLTCSESKPLGVLRMRLDFRLGSCYTDDTKLCRVALSMPGEHLENL